MSGKMEKQQELLNDFVSELKIKMEKVRQMGRFLQEDKKA